MKNEIEQLTAAKKINDYLGTNIEPFYIIIFTIFIIFEVFYILTQYLNELYENENEFIYIYNSSVITTNLYKHIHYLSLSFNIPILIFYILNKIYNTTFWNFLGQTVHNDIITSSEKKQHNKLIYYPKNTYSSSCQICAGVYFIIRCNTVINYKTTFILGINTCLMGVFSYLWWSSSKGIVRKIDHLFMELHCISLSFSFISLLGFTYDYNIENELLLITLYYTYFRATFIKRAKVGILILFINMSALLLMINLKNVGNLDLYYGGFISILTGLIFKTIDAIYGFIWGTAFFHMFASLAFVLCFEWSQTLPIQSLEY